MKTQNIKRFAPKFHIKTGDTVMVLTGDDKGQTGVVKEIIAAKNRAIVDQLNMVKKHTKATQEMQGGIHEIEASIHISNLMLVDPKSGKASRIGRKKENGKSVRYSKKSGEIIK
ncbi:MAG TPA: 50S ribosomal protein L24 [Saprospiraceae bacterium]|nr:50S ribosomal protein L24 [Saprospiraceae bacterium]MCB9329213.1 50S ribosomal protein L24 [Lewinellaceae bacterium]HPK09689.1 50S ribosomal protein L24 [Saprospiraceae bacterium]HPQ20696.1 50S ribosomal protein L24 [Saprospiraceae bacterium]